MDRELNDVLLGKAHGDALTLSQTSPGFFTCLLYKSFENTAGKGETARNEQFLCSPQCFSLFEELSSIFIEFEIVVCKLFQFGSV